ncbi:hypothetical protein ACFO5O_05530 [Geojedonia litorea]|uniref:DKNYY family protein n=1 Tax=Geojedonia litorea TaxID=1268269 RepID=A0ABV9N2R2_9FLAO
MRNFIILVFALIFLTSCGNDEKPKVIYPENGVIEIQELKKDSTRIEIADLPIHIDSTNYLIHPIGEYEIYYGSRSSYFSSSSYGSGSFSFSGYREYEISGNLYNLIFEDIESEKTRMLTDKNIRIKSVRFLNKIFEKTSKQILVYRVLDKDTNRDNKLNDSDISTLYISNIDGTKFTKLTAEFHELIDWDIVPIKNRLYFRSIEDSNRNGDFDKEDKISYQFIDLSDKEWKIKQYKPI